jgi:hypothetical protein
MQECVQEIPTRRIWVLPAMSKKRSQGSCYHLSLVLTFLRTKFYYTTDTGRSWHVRFQTPLVHRVRVLVVAEVSHPQLSIYCYFSLTEILWYLPERQSLDLRASLDGRAFSEVSAIALLLQSELTLPSSRYTILESSTDFVFILFLHMTPPHPSPFVSQHLVYPIFRL